MPAADPIPHFNVGYQIEPQGTTRLYYFLGGRGFEKPASLDPFWEHLKTKQEANGTSLELRKIEPKEKFLGFQPAPDYIGRAICVLKHNPDDPDYTKGTHLGYNALETFEIIEKLSIKHFKQLKKDSSATQNLQSFLDSVTKEVNLLELEPAYNGADKVYEKLSGKPYLIEIKAAKKEESKDVPKQTEPTASKANNLFKSKIAGFFIFIAIGYIAFTILAKIKSLFS